MTYVVTSARSTESSGDTAKNSVSFSPPAGVLLESVLSTDQLNRRPARQADYEKENRSLLALAQHLADSPDTILQKLAEVTLDLFQAGTAGVSLVSKETGDFYWPAIAGAWTPYVGGGTPRHFGPCGVVLDRNAVQLFTHAHKYYPYLAQATPPMEEGLLTPFYVKGQAVGTVWVITHDLKRTFDSEDMRVLVSLGTFASGAYQTLESLREARNELSERQRAETELERRLTELQQANIEINDSRRTALNLMSEALEARRAIENSENALRKSEERFRAFVTTSSDVVYRMNPDWTEMRHLHGKDFIADTPDPTRTWLEKYIHPDDRPRVLAAIREAIRGKGTFQLEHRVIRVDGTFGWTSSRAIPLLDANGEITEWFGAASDVTERWQAEIERQKFVSLADQSTEFIGMCDLKLKLFYVNEAGRKRVGISSMDEACRTPVSEFFFPEDREFILHEFFPKVLREGRSEVEVRFRHLETGEPLWMIYNVFYVRGADGKPVGLATVSRDITERKRAENLLRASEARFRAAVSAVSSLIWTNNALGEMAGEQPGWSGFTGQTRKELQGYGWAKAVHPDDAQPTIDAWNRAVAEKRTFEFEHRVRRKDGEWRSFSIRAVPVIDDGGEICEWVGVHTDITERKRAEEFQKRAEEKLEKTVAERTAKLRETVGDLEAFSYSIAHDMRAPLRSLQGFSDILLAEYSGNLDQEGQRYLSRIAASADRMDKLIQDVLNYSRIVRGESVLARVDVEGLLRGIVETYPMFTPDKVEVILEGSFPPVLGNEAMLTQVFSNLMGNAAKFVPPGTKPRINISAESYGRHVRVFVRDNGIGIAADQHEKIFGIFQRVEKTYEGTGIGLAIVKKAVERMGCSVGLESEVDKGSTFWIEMLRA